MAFNSKELANVGYSGSATGESRTLWMYANSAEDNVDGTGFFNDASDMLRPGDLIIDGGGQALRFVNTITDGVVALAAPDVTVA